MCYLVMSLQSRVWDVGAGKLWQTQCSHHFLGSLNLRAVRLWVCMACEACVCFRLSHIIRVRQIHHVHSRRGHLQGKMLSGTCIPVESITSMCGATVIAAVNTTDFAHAQSVQSPCSARVYRSCVALHDPFCCCRYCHNQ